MPKKKFTVPGMKKTTKMVRFTLMQYLLFLTGFLGILTMKAHCLGPVRAVSDLRLRSQKAPGEANQASKVGIQYMITNKMRKILQEELGYRPEEVDEIDPQIAAVVINRRLPRPSTGMPVKWLANRRKPTLAESAMRTIVKFGDSMSSTVSTVTKSVTDAASPTSLSLVVLAVSSPFWIKGAATLLRILLNSRGFLPGSVWRRPSIPLTTQPPKRKQSVDMKGFQKAIQLNWVDRIRLLKSYFQKKSA